MIQLLIGFSLSLSEKKRLFGPQVPRIGMGTGGIMVRCERTLWFCSLKQVTKTSIPSSVLLSS